MVICMQQWGYNLATTGDGTSYDLLLPCSDFNLGYISNNVGAGEVCGCKATLTDIKLSRATRSFTLCWFTLGKQQWGYIQTPNSSTTVDLNIPYTAAHYACFAQKADGKSGNAVEAWAGITAISLTNFTIRTHYDNTNYFLSCGQ